MTTMHLAGPETDSGEESSALLTITVDEEGTVFSGVANVRRYDQPSAAEIATYVRGVFGDDPQRAEVRVVADDATCAQITQAFGDYDIDLNCVNTSRCEEDAPARGASDGPSPASHPVTSEWAEIGRIPVRRPTVEPRRGRRFAPSAYLLAGVVGLVAVACAAAIWIVAGRGSGSGAGTSIGAGMAEPAATTRQTRSPDTGPSQAPSSSPEPSDAEPEIPLPEKVTLEQNGLSVELPVGFHLEADGDMWRVTGPDPDFRLQMAVDPLYGMAPEAVMRQVEKDIEADPALHRIDGDETSILYEHDLPDGSHAQWRTWTDRDVQLSLGCHTRQQPSAVQSATCAMANDSARFTPPE